MKKALEVTYGKTVRGIFATVNPIKKIFIKTYCIVHKFINVQAIEMLKNEGYIEQYEFFSSFIKSINEGAVWADQDFKSSNHFYHHIKHKGLFGFSNALQECKTYYNKAIVLYRNGNKNMGMFYFGVACHLIQDMTVPQHVHNKLLSSHRKFELWIINKLLNGYDFGIQSGIIRYDTLLDYVENNVASAYETYLKYCDIKDEEERYTKISCDILKQAQKSTAGFMLTFYDCIIKNKEKCCDTSS